MYGTTINVIDDMLRKEAMKRLEKQQRDVLIQLSNHARLDPTLAPLGRCTEINVITTQHGLMAPISPPNSGARRLSEGSSTL